MGDSDSTRPATADPAFLASLSDIDTGSSACRPAADSRPPATSAPTRDPVVGHHARRPLLDLFPPLPTPAARDASPDGVGGNRPLDGNAPPPAPAAAAPAYDTFYGLQEKPFSLAPDLRFLYHSTPLDRAAQQLLSAIRHREDLVILTGEAGTGKTTLCRAVGEELDRRTLVALLADPFVSVEDLLKTVLVEFGVISRADIARGVLARATRQELSATVREFLLSLGPLDAFAVIMADEAQNLTPDVLSHLVMTCDVQADARLAQVVLVGERTLLPLLRRAELGKLDSRVRVRAVLEPLPPDEVGGYVMHRLAVAGGSARVEFDDGAIARLYRYSHGVPRTINLLCDRALALGYERSASVIDESLIHAAAEDLDLLPPESMAARILRQAALVAAFVLLVLSGATAAGFVFRDQLSRIVAEWEAIPPPPPRPILRTVTPLQPLPATNNR